MKDNQWWGSDELKSNPEDCQLQAAHGTGWTDSERLCIHSFTYVIWDASTGLTVWCRFQRVDVSRWTPLKQSEGGNPCFLYPLTSVSFLIIRFLASTLCKMILLNCSSPFSLGKTWAVSIGYIKAKLNLLLEYLPPLWDNMAQIHIYYIYMMYMMYMMYIYIIYMVWYIYGLKKNWKIWNGTDYKIYNLWW